MREDKLSERRFSDAMADHGYRPKKTTRQGRRAAFYDGLKLRDRLNGYGEPEIAMDDL